MKYVYLVIGVMGMALLGYGVYALYPRFALLEHGVSLPVLAVVAGVASFFSPCSFSLLVALLARESGITENGITPLSTHRVWTFALALAVGASLFFVLVAIGIAIGASALFASVTFTSSAARAIRLVTGVVLILLGLMQLGLFANWFSGVSSVMSPLMRYQARHRRQAPTRSFFVLGFAYPAAGFG